VWQDSEMTEAGADLIEKRTEKWVNMEYEWKRVRSNAPTELNVVANEDVQLSFSVSLVVPL
jgi:hypothetical protein